MKPKFSTHEGKKGSQRRGEKMDKFSLTVSHLQKILSHSFLLSSLKFISFSYALTYKASSIKPRHFNSENYVSCAHALVCQWSAHTVAPWLDSVRAKVKPSQMSEATHTHTHCLSFTRTCIVDTSRFVGLPRGFNDWNSFHCPNSAPPFFSIAVPTQFDRHHQVKLHVTCRLLHRRIVGVLNLSFLHFYLLHSSHSLANENPAKSAVS